ncbi:hypothetical protein, partial [Paraglaciecola sp.]|uniref:hypothetical protein n=1 Tax=Paraglaciecola sp. TaxID=1920173 RepID=UPI0030F49623
LETARLLAALIRPNHLVRLSSWGLIHLPPPCNSNDFGYSSENFPLEKEPYEGFIADGFVLK